MNEIPSSLSEAPPAADDALIVFLAIGVVINLLLIAAYFVWARKQWNKSDRSND